MLSTTAQRRWKKGDWLRGASWFGSGRNVAATVPVPLFPPGVAPTLRSSTRYHERAGVSKKSTLGSCLETEVYVTLSRRPQNVIPWYRPTQAAVDGEFA